MKGQMKEPEKPLISILMAVYEPRLNWLREQLDSLEAQTYPNLKLYIRDDCSPGVSFEEICRCVGECIRLFPYEIRRNEKNLGSNLTFERLTKEAEGDYFAYCDQDDVWLPEKLSILYDMAEDAGATLAYSDMRVIDGEGSLLADSLRELRPRLHYLSGDDLVEAFFFRNCAAGCSMLVRREIAQRAVPFPKDTVWDHWIAIVTSRFGKVMFTDEKLVFYRQHLNNQTGVLKGIASKADYRIKRLEPLRERLKAYERLAVPSEAIRRFISARLEGRVPDIWRYRQFSPFEAKLETVMRLIPERLFATIIKKLRKDADVQGKRIVPAETRKIARGDS